jgi:hypothetical protein
MSPRFTRIQPTTASAVVQVPVRIGKEANSSQNSRRNQTAKLQKHLKGPSATAATGTPRTSKATVATPKTEKTASVRLLKEVAATVQASPIVSRQLEVSSGKRTPSVLQKRLQGDAVKIKGGACRKSIRSSPIVKAESKNQSKGPFTNTRSKALNRS